MTPLLLLVGLAHAAPITLDEARAQAVRRGLEVELAASRAAEARADVRTTWADQLPSVTAFSGASTGSGRTSSGFDRPVGTQLGVGAYASWTVISPSTWAAASAARHTADGQDALRTWSEVDARRAATAAFGDVVAAEAAVGALEASLDDAVASAGATDQRVQAGIRAPVDAARTRAEAASVAARLSVARGQLATACATLLGVMGQTPTASCEVSAPSWDSALVSPQAAPELEHPALRAAMAVRDAARAARTESALGWAPTVELSSTAAAYGADGEALAPGWSAGVEVELPLLTGGSNAAEVQAARAAASSAETELAIQRRDLEVATVSAEARYRAAFATVEAQRAALEAASAALDLVEQRHAAGIAPLQEWLDARRDRDDAAIGLAEARRAQLVALAEVEAARGVY